MCPTCRTSNNRIGFSYDRSDQPVSMWGIASGSYAYDAHNRRVKQVINGETIYSVYGLDGTLRYRDNATTGGSVDYLFMGGRAVVRVNRDVAGGPLSTSYIHHDHLGSSASATNSVGNILWREHYTPFGETLNNPAGNADNPGFTGHIRDTATGLTYAQARYYDPAIGRFLSNDPVGFASGGPGYFNRYAYTANDPVNATDPTGKACHPLNVAGQFCRNAARYARYDSTRSVRAQTNFFKAAASVSDSFGSFDLGFGLPRLFTSQNTRHHMRQINARLARVNQRAYEQFRNGTWQDRGSVEANDNAMVQIEQSEIQSYLGDLAETDNGQYTDLISNMNDILNNGAAGLELLDPDVALAGQRVRDQLGRDIDFANQNDREAIGRELVRYYRELREE